MKLVKSKKSGGSQSRNFKRKRKVSRRLAAMLREDFAEMMIVEAHNRRFTYQEYLHMTVSRDNYYARNRVPMGALHNKHIPT